MSPERAQRVTLAALTDEIATVLAQAVLRLQAEDALARNVADDGTANRLQRIEHQLELTAKRLLPPASSPRSSQSNRGFSNRLSSAMLVGATAIVALVGVMGGRLVSDRVYADGVAVGYARAAIFERDHPAQWRAYQRRSASIGKAPTRGNGK